MRRNLFLTFLLLLTVTWSMGQKDPAKEKEAALQEAFQPVDLSKFVTTPVVQNKGSKAVLNEGFEGTTFPPDGWKVINGGDDNTWTRYTSTPITGTASASIFYSSTAHDDWLITPPLQVASGDAITFKAKNHNAGYLEEFHVKLSTTGNNAADFTVTLASNVAPPDTVTTYTYDLSAYAGQVVYVALQAISTDMWRLYVDDFSGPTIYIPPTDLMVTGLNKDYRLIPIGQLNPALELSTRVKNNGQDLNDAVNATVEVLDAANTVLFTSTDAVSVPLAYNTQTTVTAATPFNATALTVGSYSYKHQVTYATDYNPTDNTDVFNFQVTDYLYAKDAGVVAGGVGSSSATITLGNKFQIFTDAILSGVQIQWPAALAAGSLNFQVALYAVDGSNAVTSTVFTSGNLTRTQEMQGTTVTFPVTPVAIAPGTYILAVKQLTTTNIAIGFDGATAYGSFFIANNAANPTSFTANTLYGNLTLRMDLTPKRIVTFNVTDGTDPINNASITVKSGAVTVATGITNASGAAQVYVVDGNYTYTVTATGYTTISDQAFTVAGNGTVNVTMTIAPPAPGVEPYTWNYGSLHIETQSAKVFNVKNVGTGVLQVAPADITLGGDNADQFILTTLADTANLAMGQQAPFTVTFAPTSVGEKNAVIIVQGQTLATITGTAFDATINTFPYTQSFDDVTFPPLGWVNQKVAGTGIPGVWDRQTAGTNPTCSPIGTAMIRYNCFSLSGGTAGILVTPRIDFDDATDYAVVFKMYRDGMYATNLDKVEVYVNDQPNMTNATLLGTVHRSTTQAPTVSSNGWYDYSFSIPAAFYTNYAYVILKATSAYGNNIFVDEFGLKPYYNLTLVSNPVGAGTLTGAGSYLGGTVAALNATANAGYTFSHWSNANNDTLATTPAYNYTMPAADVTLTANFGVAVKTSFTVTHATTAAFIEGASIAINNQTLTTDANGYAEIYLPGGDFGFTVSKGGFESFTDTVTVGVVPVDVNVYLNELAPNMVVAPSTVDFGTVHVEMLGAPTEFTITNTGGGFISIVPADIEIAGENPSQFVYSTFTDPVVLGNGQTANFTVNFAPTEVGVKNALVKVAADTVATLTGTAVDYTINTFDYAQSFDELPFPPLGWINQNLSGTTTGVWQRVTTGTNPTVNPIGAAMLRFNCYSLASGTSAMLVTSRIDFNDASTYAVTFKMYRDGMYATYLDKVEVYVNDQPNMTNATLLGTVHRSTTQAPTVSSNGWYDYSFSIPAAFYTNYAYVILKATSAYGYNIFVDEFGLKQYHVLTLVSNPAAAGVLTGEGGYVAGTSVAVNAIANAGYAFTNWTDASNNVVSTTPAFNYTVPAQDMTLTANFTSAVQVTFNVKDFSNNAIANAVIAVNNMNLTTDASGDAMVYLAAGEYSFTVTASGYVTYTGNVTVATSAITVPVQMSDVIQDPFGLQVAVDGHTATFSWNNAPFSFVDGFETYDNFIISNIGEYTLVDNDGLPTYGISGTTFTNSGYTGSYIVFNPSATSPAVTSTSWQPHTGSKYLACFDGIPAGSVTQNNDWIIFPQILAANGMTLSFWAKSVTAGYGLERMRVLVSTTGNETSNFIAISPGSYIQVPTDWTQYTYDLSTYAGMNIYLAIQCVSSDAFALMIDDINISVAKKDESKAFLGYTVYLDGNQVATGLQTTQYVFNNVAPGNHSAGVKAVYSSGSSDIITTDFVIYPDDYPVTFNVVDGSGNPIEGATVTVNSLTATTNASGVAVINLANGTYDYSVAKLGYITQTGSVTVNFAPATVNVTMAPATFNVTFVVTSNGNPVPTATVILNPGTSTQQVFLCNAAGTVTKPLFNGNYTYRVVKSGYNTIDGEFTVNNADLTVNVNMTGVSGLEGVVRLYPNPVTSVLTVERNTTEDAVVEMFNTSGTVINSFNTTDAVLTIDVNEIPAGTYFIRLIGNNSTTIHRFIKK